MLDDLEMMRLGIDLGLFNLFGGDERAVKRWMTLPRRDLNDGTPEGHIKLFGRQGLKDVGEIVDDVRGLR